MNDVDVRGHTATLFDEVARTVGAANGVMSEVELAAVGRSLDRFVGHTERFFLEQARTGFGAREVVGLSRARRQHVADRTDPTLWLSIFEFAPGQPTTVHDHGGWGVIYGLTGRDRIRLFERRGSEDSDVDLRQVNEWTIESGEVAWWFDPPRNIHQQEALGDEHALALVLMGHDPTPLRQRQYDLETRQAVLVPYADR